MDLMEQIRLEATKFRDEVGECSLTWDLVEEAFEHGAQAALKILAEAGRTDAAQSAEIIRLAGLLDAEREARKGDSAELETLRRFRDAAKLDERTWQDVACAKNDELKAEKERSAKYREAIKRIASCESRYPGDCPGIAQMALAETENACS